MLEENRKHSYQLLGPTNIVLLIVTGCSTLPLVYTRGPTLAYWWLDSYLDLDKAQVGRSGSGGAMWNRLQRSIAKWERNTGRSLGAYRDALEAGYRG